MPLLTHVTGRVERVLDQVVPTGWARSERAARAYLRGIVDGRRRTVRRVRVALSCQWIRFSVWIWVVEEVRS